MTGVPRPSAATMATAIRPEQLGRVAVLLGGESAEREISLRSGQGVLAALHRCGVEAIGFDPAERALHELTEESVDRVFIALHGRFGEDGTVQDALELLKIPYTGRRSGEQSGHGQADDETDMAILSTADARVVVGLTIAASPA